MPKACRQGQPNASRSGRLAGTYLHRGFSAAELPFGSAFSDIVRPSARRVPMLMHLRAFHTDTPRSCYMAAALPLKRPVKVGALVRRRLRELKRTPRQPAAAVQASDIFIDDIVGGRRRPP